MIELGDRERKLLLRGLQLLEEELARHVRVDGWPRSLVDEVDRLRRRIEGLALAQEEVDTSMPVSPCMGTATAAELLGVTPTRVRQLAAQLGGVRVGRDWQIPLEAIEQRRRQQEREREEN